MGIITIGNILTLAVAAAIVALTRYMDRGNRSVDLAREYGKRLKDDIAAFTEEKAAAVRDYGVELEVQKTSAKEVLNRLALTDESLAEKADAVAKIGERITAYDKSMEELVRTTARVQENLNRLRDEASFVEQVGKKISAAGARAGEIEKNVGALELRFERENAGALQKTAESLLSSVQSTVNELQATAETVERQVEDHRAAVDRIEHERREQLARDIEIINKTLGEAVQKAAERAEDHRAAVDRAEHERREQLARDVEAINETVTEAVQKAAERAEEHRAAVDRAEHERREQLARDVEAINETVSEAVQKAAECAEDHRAAVDRAEHERREQLARDVETINETVSEAVQKAVECAEDHRAAVDRAEHERREQFDRDVETLNKTLGEAVQKAALRAEKLEEASLVKLREEAMERLDRFQSALEQKFSEYQENAKNRVGEIHQLITGCREEWMQEHRDLEEKQLEYRGSWQRDIEAMDALAVSQHEQWKAAAAKTEERIAHLGDELSDRACEAERKILKAAEERLAEYGEIQERQWERISGAADDAAKLEAQLRLLMENAQEQVRCDFALYEEEQKQERERGTEEVRGAIDDIKNDVAGVEQELNELKNRAYENVSEKLRVFEDEFFDDIARRHEDIETRLGEWKANLDAGLDDARSEAENNFKAEAGRYNLALAETMKQNQRETETRLGAFSAQIDEWGNRFRSAQEQMRQEQEDWQARYASQLRDNEDALEDWKTRYQGQIREAEENLEETRRKTRELAGDADARIAALKGQVEEVRQGVRDFTAQTRLFEKADELKISLERGMEDLKAELDGIDQRRAEAAQLEAEFVKIRRLEDEVNSKMTRFLTEKHHLEIMERDFTRLIETSQKVEERLRDVTNSDDTLQGIQVAIRKLGDSIADADEKFLRLEKKNQVLDETRSSIDRNFSVLEETETILARCGQDITRSQNELDLLKPDIEALAAANKTAQEAQERLTRLDSDLANIEERMEKMQIAREWLAQTETRFTDINRQTREQFKLMEALLKDEGRSSKNERNTPTIAMRENVIKLARQGWERDKIAAGLKLSRGEVDLILEMGQRN